MNLYEGVHRQGLPAHDVGQRECEHAVIGPVTHFRADETVGGEEVKLEVIGFGMVGEGAGNGLATLCFGQPRAQYRYRIGLAHGVLQAGENHPLTYGLDHDMVMTGGVELEKVIPMG